MQKPSTPPGSNAVVAGRPIAVTVYHLSAVTVCRQSAVAVCRLNVKSRDFSPEMQPARLPACIGRVSSVGDSRHSAKPLRHMFAISLCCSYK